MPSKFTEAKITSCQVVGKALQGKGALSSMLQAELVVHSVKGLLGRVPTRASAFHESGD